MSSVSTDLATGPHPPNALLYSNSIHRKIHRNFFRNDVALKSYKCDLLGTDVCTAAKIYVSNSAIYIVHRPKRRKLTTIPFSVVTDIVHFEDTESVKIYISNRTVYTLTNFQRPEPAIAFLVNFWKLILKEKVVPKEGTSLDAISADNPTPTQRCPRSPANGSLRRHLDHPTSVSLNNSASVSEQESIGSGSPSVMMIPPATITEPSYEHRQITAPSVIDSRPGASPSEGDPMASVCTVPSSPPENSPSITAAPTLTTTPKMVNPECVTTQRSSIMPPLLRETTLPLSPHNIKQPNPPSTSHSPSRNGALFATDSTHGPKLVVQLTETSNWSVWPLSFLPYPFSPSPQRFTIIIAYAVLAFLLFSTMHLYHRVTLFNPSMEPSLSIPPDRLPSASSTSNDPRDQLHVLAHRLSQLVDLTSAFARSLTQLAGELRSLQDEVKPKAESSDGTSAD